MKHGDINKKKQGFAAACPPVPDYMTCANCGLEINYWTEADVTRCFFCGNLVFFCESTVH